MTKQENLLMAIMSHPLCLLGHLYCVTADTLQINSPPSLPLLSSPPLRPGVCGTIAVAHQGKWVPCVWWRGAVAVTRYMKAFLQESIFHFGRGQIYELKLLSFSFCFTLSRALRVPSVGILTTPEDFSDKRLKSVGWGPLLLGLPLVWVFWVSVA